MNNQKVKEIIKFSFYKNIQNKWFIIFNIITFISIIILLNWSAISSLFKNDAEVKTFKIEILDNNNLVYDKFINELQDNTDLEISKVLENIYTSENIPNDLALIEVIPDPTEGFIISITSKEGINTNIYTPIKDALSNIRNTILAATYNLQNGELDILQRDLDITRIMLGVNANDSDTKELIKLFSSALTYILTILIFSKMANEIAQEKQSKSCEYILTTVSAKEYLFAKIFSNISILIIQGLLLFVYYFIAIGIMNIINIATTDITLNSNLLSYNLSLDTVLYVLALIIYSILNLILLCIIQATLSAKTASTSEAGNTVSLLTFMMMGAYIATIYIITPYTKINAILYVVSCIPILSAYFVPAMMVIGQAHTIQIIISLALLIISIPFTFNYCSKIFKNGILDYKKITNKKHKSINTSNEKDKLLTIRKMTNVGFVTGIAILIYIGLQTILSLLGNFILPTLLPTFFTSTDITLLLQMILQITSLGIASAFVFSYCNKQNKNTTKNILSKKEDFCKETHSIINNKVKITIKKIKIVLIALLLVFGLQILLSGVLYPKLGLDYEITDMFEVNVDSNILSKIILIVTLAITPAIFEELFFRKALIDFTLPHGKNFALLFSSLLFGILHMNLSQGLFAFIIGLIFGAIYLYTKDIKICMLIHFINNGFAAIAMILPDTTLILITIMLFAFLVLGLIYLIQAFININSRNAIKERIFSKINLNTINTKYKYILTDFIFDVSIILIFIMSVLTEKMLR